MENSITTPLVTDLRVFRGSTIVCFATILNRFDIPGYGRWVQTQLFSDYDERSKNLLKVEDALGRTVEYTYDDVYDRFVSEETRRPIPRKTVSLPLTEPTTSWGTS